MHVKRVDFSHSVRCNCLNKVLKRVCHEDSGLDACVVSCGRANNVAISSMYTLLGS